MFQKSQHPYKKQHDFMGYFGLLESNSSDSRAVEKGTDNPQ